MRLIGGILNLPSTPSKKEIFKKLKFVAIAHLPFQICQYAHSLCFIVDGLTQFADPHICFALVCEMNGKAIVLKQGDGKVRCFFGDFKHDVHDLEFYRLANKCQNSSVFVIQRT